MVVKCQSSELTNRVTYLMDRKDLFSYCELYVTHLRPCQALL